MTRLHFNRALLAGTTALVLAVFNGSAASAQSVPSAPQASCVAGCWQATVTGAANAVKRGRATFTYDEGSFSVRMIPSHAGDGDLWMSREHGLSRAGTYKVFETCVENGRDFGTLDRSAFAISVSGPRDLDGATKWSVVGVSGTVTITSLTKTRIVGTFDFTGCDSLHDSKIAEYRVHGSFQAIPEAPPGREEVEAPSDAAARATAEIGVPVSAPVTTIRPEHCPFGCWEATITGPERRTLKGDKAIISSDRNGIGLVSDQGVNGGLMGFDRPAGLGGVGDYQVNMLTCVKESDEVYDPKRVSADISGPQGPEGALWGVNGSAGTLTFTSVSTTRIVGRFDFTGCNTLSPYDGVKYRVRGTFQAVFP